MFPIFASLVMGLAATGQPGPPERLRDSTPPLRVSVLTFNIRYGTAEDKENAWPHRKDQVFEILKEDPLDVAGLQEALRSQLDEIRAACPKLGEIGVGRDDGKTRGEYAAILYRTDRFKPVKSGTFWLSEQPEKPGSMSWKTACTRICTWAELEDLRPRRQAAASKVFWVFNAHMDHMSAEARLNGARLIARRIAERGDNAPFILMGDFNAGEADPPVRYFLAPPTSGPDKSPLGPLVDTFRVVNPAAEDTNTSHNFDPTRLVGKKIDYVLVQPDAHVGGAWIDRRHKPGPPVVCPSDHFPVGAIVELPDPPARSPEPAKAK